MAADVIASKASGLADGVADLDRKELAEMNRRIKRYCEAEKSIVAALETLSEKASDLVIHGGAVADWAKKAKGPDAEVFKKRAKEYGKAVDGCSALSEAIDALLSGRDVKKTALPGDALQKVLDALEFKDKVKTANLRKSALAYYPAESAGRKKLREWEVHLEHLVTAVNEGLAVLNPEDKVEYVHLEFGRQYVITPALALKKKIDTLGL
ncbi:MAG: hypothetical protein AB7Q97_20960 [Gammaproteobacteria bacterium]